MMISEYDGRLYSLNDYEQIVESAINTKNIDALIEHSEKLREAGCEEAPSALSLDPQFTIESWMEFLNKNGSNWAKEHLCINYLAKRDYDMVSWIIESFVKGLEGRGESVPPMLYYQIGYYKYLQIDDNLPLGEMHEKYDGKIISTGQWYKKAIEAGFNPENIDEGKWCIDYYNSWERKSQKREMSKAKEGCYIATAIYGSYDCPEVWTLRRFRDNVLYNTLMGKGFIKLYYRISPGLVEKYGNNAILNMIGKKILDSLVIMLNKAGIKNTYYNDK